MIRIHTSTTKFPVARFTFLGLLFLLIFGSNLYAAEGRSPLEYLSYTFEVGGITMYALLALSIVGLGFAIERFARLHRKNFITPGLVDEARSLQIKGEFQALVELAQSKNSGLARGIEAIVPYLHESVDEVRTIASDVLSAEVRAHQRRVQPQAAIATLAPLLGLFGTVVGMMGAFENFRMLGETGDPTVFAGDISKAMVTTATGLVVAMPALALNYILKNRTNALGDSMAMELSQLISEWCLERRDPVAENATHD